MRWGGDWLLGQEIKVDVRCSTASEAVRSALATCRKTSSIASAHINHPLVPRHQTTMRPSCDDSSPPPSFSILDAGTL